MTDAQETAEPSESPVPPEAPHHDRAHPPPVTPQGSPPSASVPMVSSVLWGGAEACSPRPRVARHSGCPPSGLSRGWAHQPLSSPAFAGHLQREAPGEPEGCRQPPAGAGAAGPGWRVSRPRKGPCNLLGSANTDPLYSLRLSPHSLYTPGTTIFHSVIATEVPPSVGSMVAVSLSPGDHPLSK